jgi:hypothetical protein
MRIAYGLPPFRQPAHGFRRAHAGTSFRLPGRHQRLLARVTAAVTAQPQQAMHGGYLKPGRPSAAKTSRVGANPRRDVLALFRNNNL